MLVREINGKIVPVSDSMAREATPEEIKQIEARKEIMTIEQEIIALKSKLRTSDYLCLKHADGALTDEEYAPHKAQRQSWRDEINSLQNRITELGRA